MFPQYSLAISSEAPPPAPPSLVETTALTGGGGLLPPHGGLTSFPSLDLPPLSPPVSEAPEPTTLLSGALGVDGAPPPRVQDPEGRARAALSVLLS